MNPIMREDEHHVDKHGRILGMIEAGGIGTVFFGDSLTRRWEDNPQLWERYFSGFAPANFGMGADTLENMKWRALNGELENIKPRVLVFLGGTNNLPTHGPDYISAGIKELTEIFLRKLPSTRILLLGVFPRSKDENGKDFGSTIRAVNSELERFVSIQDQERILYADPGPKLLNSKGEIDFSIMDDGLHLNAKGYEILGPILAELIEGLWTPAE